MSIEYANARKKNYKRPKKNQIANNSNMFNLWAGLANFQNTIQFALLVTRTFILQPSFANSQNIVQFVLPAAYIFIPQPLFANSQNIIQFILPAAYTFIP